MAGNRKFYEFGRFSFDVDEMRLEHDGVVVDLPARSLETLRLLVEKRGQVVLRQQLLDSIWADSFVEDANLTVAVSTLRKALLTFDPQPLIETVPRKGYRFAGNAEERIKISKDPITIERHGYGQLTVERVASGSHWRAYAVLFTLLGMVTATVAYSMWYRSEKDGGDSRTASERSFADGEARLNKREPCESIPYFRVALGRDAAFARAYSHLATALLMCGDAKGEADELVTRALELDPRSSDAHAADGFIKLFREWNWDGAESALRSAIALDPDSAKAHHWLGVCLSIRGRMLEAIGEVKRAIEIEPASPLYHADLCQLHYFYSDTARAIGECQRALELDEGFVFTPKYLRDIYLLMGDESRAREYDIRYLQTLGTPAEMIEAENDLIRAHGYKAVYAGRIKTTLDHLADLDPNEQSRSYALLADNYADLKDRENTLLWLEKSLAVDKKDRLFSSAYLGVDPRYKFLRNDQRFVALLEKMGLSERGSAS